MASVVISGDTSGSVTITAPAVAGTPTLTLPTTTGTLATLTTPSFGTTIGVGGATASASGSGISFPATQSASSDANTLDDYEEGTWTPTDQSGAGLSLTVASSPSYTKIGRMVTVMARITYPSTASGSNMLIGGLPFTSASSANGGDPGGFLRYSSYGSGLMVETIENSTTFRCWTLAPAQVTNANASAKRFDFVMTYFV
jgi:hypothetical protein